MKAGLWIRRLLALVIFLALLTLVFKGASDALTIKNSQSWTVRSFYKEKKDTADVIILGSSHAYRSFLPMKLWEDKGYTSYCLATSSQTFMASYYLLKEAVRTQHPKVVVLEPYAAWYDTKYGAHEVRAHAAFDYMPLNGNKLDLWWNELRRDLDFGESFSYLFPVTLYHERWQELKKSDFQDTDAFFKGAAPSSKVSPQTAPDASVSAYESASASGTTETESMEAEQTKSERSESSQAGSLADVTADYLQKIIDLCSKEEIRLVVMPAPMPLFDRYEICRSSIDAAVQQARESGADGFTLEEVTDAVQPDFSTDFYNSTHFNLVGAEKMTAFLEEYLDEHADLEDHRGDVRYASWTSAQNAYSEKIVSMHSKMGA